jgi:glycosyltransferase involved in cell wall biosynthesis
LFVGWDWARKNGDAVVRAFLALREQVPDATLDVVGHHPPLDDPGVTGHGPLSLLDPEARATVEQLFHRSTCFVMPSLIEPFGIVYVEAAMAGIPSIGTTIGGTSESIGDGGLRVDPEDPNALLRAMREMTDAATAAELGRIANARAAGLTWRLTAERILRSADLSWPEPVELADFL